MSTARGFVLGAIAAGGGLALCGACMRRRHTRFVRELSATREQLDGMLANLSEAVTVTDRSRRVRYANHAAADLLGHASPEELVAQPLDRIAACWDSTLEDGRPMMPEDVPSWRLVHGLPATLAPLGLLGLGHVLDDADRQQLALTAAQRGRLDEPPAALPRAGRRGAGVVDGLRRDAPARRGACGA